MNKRFAGLAVLSIGMTLSACRPAAGVPAEPVPEAADDGIDAGNVATLPAENGNLYFETPWNPRLGLILRLTPSAAADRRIAPLELHLKPDKPALRKVGHLGGELPVDPSTARWRPESLPSEARDTLTWVLKIRTDGWLLYADDRLAAWFPAPFKAGLTVAARTLAAGGGRVALQNVFFQRIEPWFFSDDFMIPEDEDAGLGEWRPVSGQWHVHTVLDAAKAPSRRGRTLDPEFSPNFYSLKGMGTNALIATGHAFYDHYRHAAAVELQPGEMGLVFYYDDISLDYYVFALTLGAGGSEDPLATLWRTVDGDPERRQYLAAARAPDMLAGQWARMEVDVRHDRILARLDGHLVFDLDHDLTPGGRFGFFVDADADIIFDDVTATYNPDLDLRDSERIRFHRLAERGEFFKQPQRSVLARLMGSESPASVAPQDRLSPAVSPEDQWLALGSPCHAGQVVSAVFHPDNQGFHAGWVMGLAPHAGRPADRAPHWRFSAQRFDHEMIFRLFRVDDPERPVLLEQFRRPAQGPPSEPVGLMVDMSSGRRIRFYYNRTLVLLHEPDEPPAGGIGPFIGAGSAVTISDLNYGFARDDLWTTQTEKNPIFMNDPFMRHWSSPAGEWFTDNAGLTWHKGDFFGRFDITLPVIAQADVHLGIQEGKTNGVLIVRIRNGVATLLTAAGENNPPLRVVSAELLSRRRDSDQQPVFSLHNEDHWFYITVDNRTVLRHALARSLTGTRVRIEGFDTEDLEHSEVLRHQVEDHLFTEAPVGWRLNGGDWRVVNRFQCDPRWSHMNAESSDNLAAAWTKHIFDGDFSIEMYAGMRHGWYKRCGDMNLTALSSDGTASQGYTVTCTGWDHDQSQLDSVFYRQGLEIDRSDAYLAPRHREGNRRRRRENIIQGGRDVHGAWYYIKLRRIGNRVEYYFDNELVFEWDDDDPLSGGRVGLWTYMNSIMIARASISARERSLAPLNFEPLAITDLKPPSFRMAAADVPDSPSIITNAWMPPMQPEAWEADDPVGQARLAWHQDAYYGNYFTITTRLGGGPMFARTHMPPWPYSDLAGWRFFLKRSERANFNVYFSIGQLDRNGNYSPRQHYFHRISGADFDRDAWLPAGATEVAGTAPGHTPQWHAKGRWTPVDVWVTGDGLPAATDADRLWVRFEGFGLQQPSLEMQGLRGNGPGEAYAVARFHAVGFENMPQHYLAAAPDGQKSHYLFQGPSRQRLLAQGDHDAILNAVRQHALGGLNAFWVDSRSHQPGYPRDWAWIVPPEQVELEAAWCDRCPDAVILKTPAGWPERRLDRLKVRVDGQSLETTEIGLNRRLATLPPRTGGVDEASDTVRLQASVAPGQTQTFDLPTADARRRPLGPVLARLEGITPIYENFESLDFGRLVQADLSRMRIRRSESSGQGAFVEIANRARNQRLKTPLSATVCLARYPLMQFSYRGDRMSLLSMQIQSQWLVRLNESHPQAAEVRFARPLINDGRWHTWSGMISEVVSQPAFNPRMYAVQNLELGSFHNIDQTGAFSRWDLDDIVMGPAVSQSDQLKFSAHFEGLRPVKAVYMALRPGLEQIRKLDSAALEALPWQTIANGRSIIPDIDGLPEGPAQLLLRAVDTDGVWSTTATIPFLIDRTAPRAMHAFESTRHPLANESLLRLDLDTGNGAPILLETIRLGFNHQPEVEIDDFLNTVTLRSPGLRVDLNWPYLLRDAIQQHSPDEPAQLRLSGLRDGAGNAAPEIEIPIGVLAELDTRGPTLLPAVYSDAVLFNTAWEGRPEQPLYFIARNNPTSVHHPWDDEPWLRTQTHGNSGNIRLRFGRPPWRLSQHPYLAFRLRRPAMTPDSQVGIELQFILDRNQTVRLNLASPADDKSLSLPEPLNWESNRWHTVILDVPRLLSEGGVADVESRRVHAIVFARRQAGDKLPLDIQSLFVFRPWKADDTIVLDAYDQSGVGGLEWTFHDPDGQLLADDKGAGSTDPAMPGWLLVRARDRCGHLSVPLRVPLILEPDEGSLSFAQRVNRLIDLSSALK